MNKTASSIASAIFLLIFLFCGIYSVYWLLAFLEAWEKGFFFAVLFLLFSVFQGLFLSSACSLPLPSTERSELRPKPWEIILPA